MTYESILKDFYKDLLTWINEGCPEDNIYNFKVSKGLCSSFLEWTRKNYPKDIFTLGEFSDPFAKEGLDRAYPFNPGLREYIHEQNKYTNPARLNWIKEHAK